MPGQSLPGSISIVGRSGAHHRTQSPSIHGSQSHLGQSVMTAASWTSSFKRAAQFQFDRDMLAQHDNVSASSFAGESLSSSRRRGSRLRMSASSRQSFSDDDRPPRPTSSLANVLDIMDDDDEPYRPSSGPDVISAALPISSVVSSPTTPTPGRVAAHRSASPALDGQDASEHDPLVPKTTASDDGIDEDSHKSTYAQTLFNSVNILMGIGILTLPFSFKVTGWVVGLACLFLFGAITRHTAKVLALVLDWQPDAADYDEIERSDHAQNAGAGGDENDGDEDDVEEDEDEEIDPHTGRARPRARRLGPYRNGVRPPPLAYTYGDFGESAFGTAGRSFITVVFLLELFAACVALVILTADSIVALFPQLDIVLVKIGMVAFVLPFTYPKSLSMASYGSLVGIIALVNLLVIIIYDGVTTHETPGSLLVPAETDILPKSWLPVPLSFGLIMAGFCGHSVFPNLYRDMETPKEYGKLVNHTYLITTFIYIMVAACGYLMFGTDTMQEITQNLPMVPSYNVLLTQVTIWLVALNPVTKYPLAITPINTQIERSMSHLFPSLYAGTTAPLVLRFVTRTLASLAILSVAIAFPGFHNMMAILGSFFSFTVSVVFPELCYLKLYGRRLSARQYLVEVVILVMGVIFGTIGTIWACLPLGFFERA
ncbi:transmembrane amino acid transporter protein-domain-containing protein [Entophlyctis helioformis]|nr:transmembrane amino acid transporter protein-domain-containing protein [Entophlyctis helioformis]